MDHHTDLSLTRWTHSATGTLAVQCLMSSVHRLRGLPRRLFQAMTLCRICVDRLSAYELLGQSIAVSFSWLLPGDDVAAATILIFSCCVPSSCYACVWNYEQLFKINIRIIAPLSFSVVISWRPLVAVSVACSRALYPILYRLVVSITYAA